MQSRSILIALAMGLLLPGPAFGQTADNQDAPAETSRLDLSTPYYA